LRAAANIKKKITRTGTVAILAQGTNRAVAFTQAFLDGSSSPGGALFSEVLGPPKRSKVCIFQGFSSFQPAPLEISAEA
jgi:hypothetical protein